MSRIKKISKLFNECYFDNEKINLFTITYHSNAIEGSTLTEKETRILLNENLTPNCKPLVFTNMALDHYQALKYVIDIAEKKETLSVDILKKIASLVQKNTGQIIETALGTVDSTKGDFRKFTIGVGSHYFMNYQKVPLKVNELIEVIKSKIQSCDDIEKCYDLAFYAHYQLVSIHPFADGNGRSSRLLMNYIQKYCGYPMTLVFIEDKLNYYNALEKAREEDNSRIFIDFMYNQAEKYLERRVK